MNAGVVVGITTRNRESILPKAISSALAQASPDLTVSVLDDGSTDGTPALRARFPHVAWQRHETSQIVVILNWADEVKRLVATKD